LSSADGIIISFAEHNGAYTAAFKNIFDRISRVEKIVWFNKPMFLLATSDGARGAITVLKMAHDRISKGGQLDIPSFSLPNFSQNFDSKLGIIDENLKIEFNSFIKSFSKNL
jgi:NAD(P)H-dependent FMN reductase